jgi:hypothetical protein
MLATVSMGLMLVSVAAAPLEKAPKDPLADDPRLAQKVKVTVEGLPVGDVLSLLAAKTGVPLAASRETADDKVVVFGLARPLREVLADLAALFNDRWERHKTADHSDRYVLTRDLAAQQCEAGLTRDNRSRWLLPPRGNPYTGEKVAAGAPLPGVSAIHAAAAGKAWPDRLRKLAEASGIAVMADYYRGRSITKPYDDSSAYRGWSIQPLPDSSAAPADPAASALETLCAPEGYLWWIRGKTLLLRKRDWYEQQRYEVPDRWMREMAGRLKAQGGLPTYADVLRVLELTPEQTIGLEGLGEPANHFGFVGQLRELLAIVQAAPKNPSAPLPVIDHLPNEEWQKTWLRYPALTPSQRRLLGAFLDAYPYPVAAGKAVEFQARLFLDPDGPQRDAQMAARMGMPPAAYPDYRPVSVVLQFSLGDEHRLWGNFLALPTSLPDDRRDRTKIEVVP